MIDDAEKGWLRQSCDAAWARIAALEAKLKSEVLRCASEDGCCARCDLRAECKEGRQSLDFAPNKVPWQENQRLRGCIAELKAELERLSSDCISEHLTVRRELKAEIERLLQSDRIAAAVDQRIREIADDCLGLQPTDADPIALLDEVEQTWHEHRIARLNAETEVEAMAAARKALVLEP